jgi:hypothetical protein
MLATMLPNHNGDDAAEVTESMSSHAGDGAIKTTWPQRDVDAESY